MQSLHYNNGSIKLTRERVTMVARWEPNEVARWIAGKYIYLIKLIIRIFPIGLAGIQTNIGDFFLKHKINGATLGTLLREDLIRMGIKTLDQQLILMQSIDNLLTLVIFSVFFFR